MAQVLQEAAAYTTRKGRIGKPINSILRLQTPSSANRRPLSAPSQWFGIGRCEQSAVNRRRGHIRRGKCRETTASASVTEAAARKTTFNSKNDRNPVNALLVGRGALFVGLASWWDQKSWLDASLVEGAGLSVQVDEENRPRSWMERGLRFWRAIETCWNFCKMNKWRTGFRAAV
jgi:hypothetical protein